MHPWAPLFQIYFLPIILFVTFDINFKSIFHHYFFIPSGTVFVPQYLKTAQAVLVNLYHHGYFFTGERLLCIAKLNFILYFLFWSFIAKLFHLYFIRFFFRQHCKINDQLTAFLELKKTHFDSFLFSILISGDIVAKS